MRLNFHRFLAVLLSCMMLFTALPEWAFATEAVSEAAAPDISAAPAVSALPPNESYTEPSEETAGAPAETVSESTPAETVSDSTPAETVSESTPAETVSDSTPAETVSDSTPAETVSESTPAETRFSLGYVALPTGATLYQDRACRTALGALTERAVVYVFARDEKEDASKDVFSIAYADQNGAQTAYARARQAEEITAAELAAYLKKDGAAYYRGDRTLPLQALALLPAETDAPAASDSEAPAESDVPSTSDTETPVESNVSSTSDTESPVESDALSTPNTETPIESDIPSTSDTEMPAESDIPSTSDTETPIESDALSTSDMETPAESGVPSTFDTESPAESDISATSDTEMPIESDVHATSDTEAPIESDIPSTSDTEVPTESEGTLAGANVAPRSIGLSANGEVTSRCTLDAAINETVYLFATVQPLEADQSVTFVSNRSSVATVDESGLITAIAPGTAVIRVASAQNAAIYTSFIVTVVRRVTQIDISGLSSVRGGAYVSLKATVSPANASNTGVTWKSSDTTLASVSSAGVVVTRRVSSPAQVVITAAAKDGSDVSAAYTLDILPAATGVEILRDGERITALSVDPGASPEITLAARVLPDGAMQDVVWSVSNSAYAKISQNGVLTPLKNGTVVLTCSSRDGSGVRASIRLTIATLATSVAVSGDDTLRAGASTTLTALVLPFTAGNRAVSWESSDTAVATVSSYGRVTAKNIAEPSYVTITATTKDGTNLSSSHQIYVQPGARQVVLSLNGETVSSAAIDMTQGDMTLQLSASVLPDSALRRVLWNSSNKRVATVDENGLVTAHIPGTAQIYATAADGTNRRAVLSLNVAFLVSSITVTGKTSELRAGASTTLSASVLPSGANNRSVLWTSSDPTAAYVSSSGRVMARTVKERAVVTITATARDGSKVYGEYSLSIFPGAASVAVYNEDGDETDTIGVDFVGDGQTLALSARVLPKDAAQGIIWSSSDARVASVDKESGLVTVRKQGIAYITARTTDGSNKSKRVTLNVCKMVQSLSVSGPERLAGGRSAALTVTVTPADATIRAVRFSTEDTASIYVNSSSGRVTARYVSAPVTVTVRATATDGSGVYQDYSFELTPAVRQITILNDGEPVKAAIALDAGDETMNSAQLSAQIAPDGAWNAVKWVSSSPSVASIDENGFVTALKNGTAYITASALDGSGRTARVTVSVATRVQSVSLSGTENVASGRRVTLKATVLPADASNKRLTYTSSDPSVATVSYTGSVTARALNHSAVVTIRATAQDGSGAYGEITLTVTPAAASIAIFSDGENVSGETLDYRLERDAFGESFNQPLALSAVILPEDAAQSVTWTSSNQKVATVSQDGVVTAVSTGVCTVTAMATDGTSRSSRVTIRVTVPVTDVQIEGVTGLARGRTSALTATVLPTDATNKRVVWSSLDPDVFSVTQTGMIRALKDTGSATIVATAADGSGIYGQWTVAAYPSATSLAIYYMTSDSSGATSEGGNAARPVLHDKNGGLITGANGFFEEATLAPSTVTVLANDVSVLCLNAVVSPEGSFQGVRFTSSTPSVATVFELTQAEQEAYGYTAYLQLYRRGSTVITATATDGSGVRKTFTLVVNQQAEEIEITGDTYLASGQSVRLVASVIPSTATSTAVSWTMEDDTYAYVSSTGFVTAKKVTEPTKITVIATARDGSGVFGTYSMTVYPSATDVPSVNATYRALIAVEPTDTSYGLLKRQTDLDGMAAMLRMQRFDGKAFDSIRTLHQSSAGDVLSAISSLAAQTTDADITYFYFLGHGSSDGKLIFYDGSSIAAATLKSALDRLNGRVVVMLANCFSGYYIAGGSGANAASPLSADDLSGMELTGVSPSAFCSSVISVFAGGDSQVVVPLAQGEDVSANIGELRKNKYYVLTASLYNESSWFNYYFENSGIDESRSFDRFTRGTYRAGGWDEISHSSTWSGGKSVTLAQAYSQIRSYVNSFTDKQSSVQVYPSSSSFVIFQH